MRRWIVIILALLLGIGLMSAKTVHAEDSEEIRQLKESKAKIGVEDGTPPADEVPKLFPNAEVVSLNSTQQGFLSVQEGKLDAFCCNEAEIDKAIEGGLTGVRKLEDDIGNGSKVCAGISKAGKVTDAEEKFNAFLAEEKANGVIDDMYQRWVIDGNEEMPEIAVPANPDSTIVIGTTGLIAPFSFYKDGDLTGFDIELSKRFAAWMNADLELRVYDWYGLVPACTSGQVDYILSNLFATEERKDSMIFSDPIYTVHFKMLVKADGETASGTAGKTELLQKEDFEGKKIGVITGSLFDQFLKQLLPQAIPVYTSSDSDNVQALKSGKIDGYLADYPVAVSQVRLDDSLAVLAEKLMPDSYAYVFQKNKKGEKLAGQMSEYIAKLKADGTYDELNDIWMGEDESRKTVDDPASLPAVNGTLTLATTGTAQGFSYYKDGKLVGYDIDMFTRFCKEYGYGLTIVSVQSDGEIPGVVSGKYDAAANCISITDERKKSVNFSAENYSGGVMLVCRASDLYGTQETAQKTSLLTKIQNSFYKNFVKENRWKLLLSGLGITVLISAASAVLGSVLGLLICFMRRSKNRLLSGIARVYIRILQGIPLVVLLMILYYLVFKNVNMSAVIVAVIGFAVNFSAYVAEIMRSGIDAVEIGQTEAALALGYPKQKAFWKFIFPQAAVHFIPVYKGEFISLVKMTSIVGYITIQDLTRASDIIRSRTYEAFFPLITTALIYFATAWLLTLLLDRVEFKVDPKRRRREIPGIRTELPAGVSAGQSDSQSDPHRDKEGARK